MAQISPRHPRGARPNSRKGEIRKSFGRRLVAGAVVLVTVIVLAAVLTPRGFAQPNSNKPDQFGRKADKMLQLVRKAHAHDYFGYLRRDPDASYLNWIQERKTTNNSRNMINSFGNSREYRFPFGP